MTHELRLRINLGGALLALAVSSISPNIARAQGAAATQAEAPMGLETVVVTARKRKESAQDVPVAVTAITGEEVRRRDLTSLEKVAAITPDFSVGRASNGSAAQLTLRGIGSSSTSIGIEQSVAVVIDGVYYGQGRIIEEGFFDLGQLEILKGPQALFFGKNATAGVISITTADPTQETEFQTKAAYEFKTRQTQVEAVGSGPLSDTLGIRVSLRGSVMSGGYYDNVAQNVTYTTLDVSNGFAASTHLAPPAASQSPGEREFLARATLKWTPSDELTGTLKLSSDFNHVNNSSWNYVAFNCPQIPGQPAGTRWLGPPNYACGNEFVTHQNNIPADMAANFPYARDNGALYNRYESYAVTGSLNYKLPNYTLTSVTNYNTNNNSWACDCNFQSSSTGTWATENSTWYAVSEEFRALSTFHSPVNFMLGGLVQKTKRTFDQFITFASVWDSSVALQNQYLATTKTSNTEGKTFAVFGQLIWQIAPTLEATAGARYTHETKDSVFSQPYNNAAVTAIFRPASAPLGIVTAHQVFKNFSPEATLTWKPVEDIMFYGAFKTAYKSGGFDNGGINSGFLAADPATYMTFSPEKARGFELGAKTTLLDNQLRFNVTLFDYKYLDLQVDFFNSSTFAFQTVSADARTKGVELELEYAPKAVRGLSLHATVNYDDAKYTQFVGPCYAGETAAAGCNIPTTTVPFQNLTGAQLAMAPKVTGNLGGRYEMMLGAKGMHLDWMADFRYSDKYNASSFNNPASRVGSYVSIDAGLRLTSANDKWDVALVGKNLSNRFYVTGVVDGPGTPPAGTPPGPGADQFGFGVLPRTVQFQATAHF
jgi:outer membrane receptor protein involved in Fe transport